MKIFVKNKKTTTDFNNLIFLTFKICRNAISKIRFSKPMETLIALTSQSLSICFLFGILKLVEGSQITYFIKNILRLPFLRVEGDRSLIMLLFSILCFLMFSLDALKPISKIKLAIRISTAKRHLKQNLIVILVSFLSAYSFNSLNYRILNLIIISIILIFINPFLLLAKLSAFTPCIYFGFICCNILIFSFTFIKNFAFHYTILTRYLLINN